MTTQDELPTWLLDALDKPLVGPVALIVAVALLVLLAAWALAKWDRHVTADLERRRLAAKVARPEFEAAARHWHSPPVQMWADEPREVGK